MIYNLVRRELRGRYQRSVLGFLWSFVNPLCQILVYTVVFTFAFSSGIQDYYIYLMSGLIPWVFFSESMIEGARSIIDNEGLACKIYFPREVLVISKVTAKFVNFLLSMIVVFCFLLFSSIGVSLRHIVLLPLIMIIEYMMTLGFALFFSAVTVYLRDMEYIVGLIMMAWIWGTPIMYLVSAVNGSPLLSTLIRLNPMTSIIEAYHNILYFQSYPEYKTICISVFLSAGVMCFGELVFSYLEPGFAEEL